MAIQRDEYRQRIRLEEFSTLIESDPEHRYELIDGYPCMMTGGSPDHSIIGSNLIRILGNLLQGRRCIVYNSDVYVELSEDYKVCPDVTVSCDPRDRGAKDAIHYPSLVVEVLSPTSEARDRGKKSLQYRSNATIQEYLIVSSDAPIIELFRREKNDFWTLYTLEQHDSVELTSLAVHFSVTDAYQNTSLMDEENNQEPLL